MLSQTMCVCIMCKRVFEYIVYIVQCSRRVVQKATFGMQRETNSYLFCAINVLFFHCIVLCYT